MELYYIEFIDEIIKMNKEIEIAYIKCKTNKKFKCQSKAKQKWYYKYLKDRIRHKIWLNYKYSIYNILDKVIEEKNKERLTYQFKDFINIKDINICEG